ncbi:MAG: polyphosphate kinase 1 [Flavobacteriales bacterium]|nr:polyphosphate kinase 1 [Flavobacteriales bacterium]
MHIKKEIIPFVNRELSWLDFNERVLQEAEDETVPLLERLRFLGIFSNNLDEFFRVRVATTKRLTNLPLKEQRLLDTDPKELLKKINTKTIALQNRFEKDYQTIIKKLNNEGINIITHEELLPEHIDFVEEYYKEKVRPALVPIMLSKTNMPNLNGSSIYFAIKLTASKTKFDYAIIEIPSMILSRFLVLPTVNNQKYVMLLDDIIRYKLHSIFDIFNYKKIEAYTIKVTLDAELDLDDDISEGVIDKLSKSLKSRKTAQPVRLIYDKNIAPDLLVFILDKIKPSLNDSVIAAGVYHNFKDFIKFPDVGNDKLSYRKLPPVDHPQLKNKASIIHEIAKNDILLNYPYQSFNHIIHLLREAAIDPKVTSIKINLYRVAKNSKIIHALISAAKNGKKVTVIVELRARFDEEANIYWAEKLQDEGVKVVFGIPGLKVHSKLILISRKEGNKTVRYGHVGTGNFHEGTATVYSDVSLLTKNTIITNEINKVLRLFKNTYERPSFRHLMVSPFNARRKLITLLDNEIKNAKHGHDAYAIIKLNNLVDNILIKKLYQASKAGVKIQLIIRGTCSVVPGVKNVSENIEIISIVDRFLEHARILVFCNNGNELYYISSADWMSRNLDRRIEVGCPIYDKKLQQTIMDMLTIQLKDNAKSRLVNIKKNNSYKETGKVEKNRSQIELYNYFKEQSDKG